MKITTILKQFCINYLTKNKNELDNNITSLLQYFDRDNYVTGDTLETIEKLLEIMTSETALYIKKNHIYMRIM